MAPWVLTLPAGPPARHRAATPLRHPRENHPTGPRTRHHHPGAPVGPPDDQPPARGEVERHQFLARHAEALATEVLVRNLMRAGDLVRSFKQVAVDRSHEDRRTFDLYDGALFQTEVSGMEWHDDTERWVTTTSRIKEVRTEVTVC